MGRGEGVWRVVPMFELQAGRQALALVLSLDSRSLVSAVSDVIPISDARTYPPLSISVLFVK